MRIIIVIGIILLPICRIRGQDTLSSLSDTLTFHGQLSIWLHLNPSNDLYLWSGGRYIPRLNYGIDMPKNRLIDFEASANIFGNAGLHLFDSAYTDGILKPYRIWGRYSTQQFELRLGLQKINFGSASILRPLMWFDQVDPRDPLQITDGVWGVLARYYFMNNANIWLWGLYGNKNPKGWELAKTNSKYPEAGGRIQVQVPAGETAVSYHFRIADNRGFEDIMPTYAEISENRIGLDTKFDLVVGLWFEGSWIHKNKYIEEFTNHQIINAGTDYTFGIGNGLYLVFEQLFSGYGKKAFSFSNSNTFSLMSFSYPIGLFDNISAIFYYYWENKLIYSFINWQKQYDNITLYVMAYWNPDEYVMPLQDVNQNLYRGIGIQIMFLFNH